MNGLSCRLTVSEERIDIDVPAILSFGLISQIQFFLYFYFKSRVAVWLLPGSIIYLF